jgi:hypothetical protein
MLSAQPAQVLGSRELRRIERAESALALLKERAPADHVVLHEVAGVGSLATDNLVAAL